MKAVLSARNADAAVGLRAQYLLFALAVPLVLAWLLLALMEMPRYLHDPNIPAWQPVALLLCSGLAVFAGLVIWIQSGQFDRIDLDRPREWFASQLKKLPVFAAGAIIVIYGLRYLVFTLAGAAYWHVEWPLLLTFEATKIGVFFCLWLGIAFGARSFYERCGTALGIGGAREAPISIRHSTDETTSPSKLLVPNGEQLKILDTDTIQWAEAAGNYVMVHAAGGDYLLRRTLQSLLMQLGQQHFARIHKSTVVNLDAVATLHPLCKGDYEVELRNGKRLRLSRRYRASLFSRTGH